MGFIRINNRKNFLLREIPELHPDSMNYVRFWREQKKRCIEGFWGMDDAKIEVDIIEQNVEKRVEESKSWRWMPPNLYFYVNFGTILHKPDGAPKTAPKQKIRPLLRDFEWEFFYNYMECRGFSGFIDDEEYCCLRELDQFYKDPDIDVNSLDPICFNKEGNLKQYTPCREYLRMVYTKPLGKPTYQNEAKNLFLLGARGGGKSYLNAVGVVDFEIIFDGARYYDEDSRQNPATVEVFVGAAIAAKSAEILSKSKIGMEHLPGAWGKGTADYRPAPFYKEMAGTLKSNNMTNPWRHEYEKKIANKWQKFGTGSKVLHGTYTAENPEAAAGTRPGVMVIEEVGLLANVLTVHASNEACQMTDGTVKFGTSVYIGTGGNVEKIQEAEIIFRDPEAYNFLGFDDEWENSGQIGWFVPAYYMDGNFKDKNGNTNIEAATKNYDKRREKKRQARSSAAIDGEMMNYPLKPSEMFLNAKGNMFPIADLKAVEAEIKTKPHKYENKHWFGDLGLGKNNMQVVWKNKDKNGLVREWPIKDNKNKPGMIEVFEMPKKDGEGIVFGERYIAGTDTYDDDESSTKSLGSIFIMDTWTDRIVAEFTGRRSTEEFYEITRRLCIFYRALNNYEQNKKGLFWHYKKMSSLHFLAETPESLRDVANVTISKVGNKKYGTTATPQVNAYGLRLQLKYLQTAAYGENTEQESEDAEETLNLQKIKSIGLVKEYISWTPEGNYDRVSAMGMLMILKEDKYAILQRKDERKQFERGLEQDDFFTSRYA